MFSRLVWANREEVATKVDSLVGVILPLVGIFASLVVGAVVILTAGRNPLVAYATLLDGAFGGSGQIAAGLNRSTPYLLAGLGVAIAFRAGAFNIGGEGQIALGGLAATVIGLSGSGVPPLALIPLALVVGSVAGGMWAGIAAGIKLNRGVHEVIVTLLMNFIALLIVSEMLRGPLEQPGMGFPQSPMLPQSSWLPSLLPGTNLHSGFLLALVITFVVHVVLWKTPWGFEIRTLGHSPFAACYAGIHVEKTFFLAMLTSGMLGGLAGAVEVLGFHYRLIQGFSEGFGFDAIAVALLGASNPIGVIPAALFFGFLRSGAASMQRAVGVPSSIVPIIQGLAILFVMVSLAVHLRPKKARWHPTGEAEETAGRSSEVKHVGT